MSNETTIEMNSKTVDTAVEKVSAMLDQLAQQLGIAADHFYPIFVKQQMISGYYSLLWFTVLLLIAVIFWLVTYTCVRDHEEAAFGVGFIAAVLSASAFFVGLDALTHIINPEYHALMAISEFANALK